MVTYQMFRAKRRKEMNMIGFKTVSTRKKRGRLRRKYWGSSDKS